MELGWVLPPDSAQLNWFPVVFNYPVFSYEETKGSGSMSSLLSVS